MTTPKPIVHTFDSLAAFVDYANGPTDLDPRNRQSRTNDPSFSGGVDFDGAVALAHGWHDGAKRIEAQRVKIGAKVGTSSRREIRMREVGPGTLSMGAYLSGHPQPYAVIESRNAPKRGKGKIVRIWIDGLASGGISSKIIERRGAAVCAAIDAMERAGRRVEVVVTFPNGGNSWGRSGKTARLTHRVTVKRASERLNLATLAFAVAHSAMLRRLIFSAMEREGAAMRQAVGVPGGYGSVGAVDPGKPADAIYLDGAYLDDPQWRTDEAAAKWVRETLKAQGVSIG